MKVCGYMAAPRQSGPLPCIIENRGGNRDFGAWTDTNSVRWMAPFAAAGYFVIASNYRTGSTLTCATADHGPASSRTADETSDMDEALRNKIDALFGG